MPFAATWMQLEIFILNEGSQKEKKQIPYDITYTWNLKYGTNDPTYRTERDSQTRNRLVAAKGQEEGMGYGLGVWG